jgi:hypothetical protein
MVNGGYMEMSVKPVFHVRVSPLKLTHLLRGFCGKESKGSANLYPTAIQLALELNGAETAFREILVHGALRFGLLVSSD